ncbi:hypothetical protein ILUMI_14561, partial [Ignelater luminosus]
PAVPTGTDAAAPRQSSAPAVESGLAAPLQLPRATSDSPVAPLRSHGISTPCSVVLQRASDVMSCASSVADCSSSYDSDCDDGFIKVAGRLKKRRRDSPVDEPLSASTANRFSALGAENDAVLQLPAKITNRLWRIVCASLRLLRMLIKIKRYDIKLQYVLEKYLYLTDTLSRANRQILNKIPDRFKY